MRVFLVFLLSVKFCAYALPHHETFGFDDDVGESSPFGNIYGSFGQHRQQSSAHFDTPSFSPFNSGGGRSHGFNHLNRNFPQKFHKKSQQDYSSNDEDTDYEDDSSGIGAGPKNGSGNSKIHKFISIHIAPPDEESQQEKPKPIKLSPHKAEKHYQIVFIKAPSTSPQEQQEVHLPPLPETKTLVYVLLKKTPLGDMVRIKGAPTPKPTPPQVFFIRYKGQNNNKEGGGEQDGENEGEDFPNSDPEEEYGGQFKQ